MGNVPFVSALHSYTVQVTWTGAGDTGTSSYTSYSRDHEVAVPLSAGPPVLLGSSDPVYRGDPARYNPEQLFVASLSQCHMLWFLHVAAQAGIVVVGYRDEAVGTLRLEAAGSGQFIDVVLHPRVTLAPGQTATDADLERVHHSAHEHCFLARSVNFPVRTAAVPLALVAPAVRA